MNFRPKYSLLMFSYAKINGSTWWPCGQSCFFMWTISSSSKSLSGSSGIHPPVYNDQRHSSHLRRWDRQKIGFISSHDWTEINWKEKQGSMAARFKRIRSQQHAASKNLLKPLGALHLLPTTTYGPKFGNNVANGIMIQIARSNFWPAIFHLFSNWH